MADLLTAASAPELVERAADDFSRLAEETVRAQGRMTLALSGGSTPQPFHERLTREPYRSRLPWSALWIFFGDERPVPPDHPESNFRMAQESLLSRVPIPSGQVFRLRGEQDPAQAAEAYEAQVRAVFGSEGVPAFDLILLGLGEDGHTASLFPGTAALGETSRWVVANPVPALGVTRLTFTLPLLNHAKAVWFIVTGSEKAKALACARGTPNPACPASLVRPLSGPPRWYVEEAVL